MLTFTTTDDIPPYSGWFEAHVTVQQLSDSQIPIFNHICEDLGVKSIQIQLSRGDVMVQPMTCSRHQGSFQEIYLEVLDIARVLQSNGLEVSRLKIEAHPDNIGVPKDGFEARHHSDKNYFEHHLKVLLDTQSDKQTLFDICQLHQAHLSSNAFKQMEDGQYQNFITTRAYGLGKDEAYTRFEMLKQDIADLGITILKHFTEYCVFDTNIDLDKNWLTQDSPCDLCKDPCLKRLNE